MVKSWTPEPSEWPQNDDLSIPINQIHVELDDDDEDQDINFGYELLRERPISNLIEDEDYDRESQAVERVSSTEREDIQVNIDRIRQIMSSITIPTTSFPLWANDIPESQWTSYLISRITNIRGTRN